MLKNHFRIAWRNLAKNKVYTVMNITGLAAGIAFVLLIGLLTDHTKGNGKPC